MRDNRGRFVRWDVDDYRREIAKYGLHHLGVGDDQYGNVTAYAQEREGFGIPPDARAEVFANECGRRLEAKKRLACARLLTFLRVIGGIR